MKLINKFIPAVLLSLLIGNLISAQGNDTTLIGKLKETFNGKYFCLSILNRNAADFQIERSINGYNGFSILNFRAKISGDMDSSFGYLLRTEFVNSPAILDARLYYKFVPMFKIDFGLFKPPFSAEYLVGVENILFISRSQAVNVLNSGREVGIQFSGETNNKTFSYFGGIFNGNKNFSGNDNNEFLYVMRTEFKLWNCNPRKSMALIGLNAAQSNDKKISILNSDFTGSRFLLGGDINFSMNNLLLSSEVIWAKLKNSITGISTRPFGYQVTAGYNVSQITQLLLRWDNFKDNTPSGFNRLFIFGINLFVSKINKLQFNYLIPVNDGKFKHHQFLFNWQFYYEIFK